MPCTKAEVHPIREFKLELKFYSFKSIANLDPKTMSGFNFSQIALSKRPLQRTRLNDLQENRNAPDFSTKG